MSWPLVPLSTLAEPGRGTFSNGPFGSDLVRTDLTKEGVPVIYIRDIRAARYERVSTVCVSEEKAEELQNCQVQPGDILIAKVGTPPGTAAIYPRGEPLAVITQDVVRLRADHKKLHAPYFIQWLNSSRGRSAMESITVQATRARFGLGDFKKLLVPLPPLPEQKRIAAILDKADEVRRKRAETIRLTEELLKSAFLEMFGDPVTNPKGWEVKKLGEVISETQYGTAAKANTDQVGLPVLRMNNITFGGDWDLSSLKWCEIAPHETEKYTTRKGDLLFNRTNSPELVGKTAVWETDDSYAIAGYLIRVRFKAKVVPEYVSGILNSDAGKHLIFQKAKPSNNMSNFSASELKKLEVPIPPIAKQRAFGALVERVKSRRPSMQDGLTQAEALGAALTQRAFSGRL